MTAAKVIMAEIREKKYDTSAYPKTIIFTIQLGIGYPNY